MVKEGLFDINFISSNSSNENTNKTFDAIHTISAEVKTAEKEISKLNRVNKKHQDANNGFTINLQSNYDPSKVSIPLNKIYETSGEALYKKNTIITMYDDILPDTSGFENTIIKQRRNIDELLANNEDLKKNLQISKDRINQLENENGKLIEEKKELENKLYTTQTLLKQNEEDLFRKLRNFLTQIANKTRANINAVNLRREGNNYLDNLKNYLDVCSRILLDQIDRNNLESENDKKEIEELKRQKNSLNEQITEQAQVINNLILELDNNLEQYEESKERDGYQITYLINFIREQEANYNALNQRLIAEEARANQLTVQLADADDQNVLLQVDKFVIINERDALEAQLISKLSDIDDLQLYNDIFLTQIDNLNNDKRILQNHLIDLIFQVVQLGTDLANLRQQSDIKDNILNAMQDQIDDDDDVITALLARIANLYAERALKNNYIGFLEQTYEDLKTFSENQRLDNDRLQGLITDLDDLRVDEYRISQETINRLDNALQASQISVRERDLIIKVKETIIRLQKIQLEEKDNTIHELERQVRDLTEKNIILKNRRIPDLNNQVIMLYARTRNLNERIKTLEGIIGERDRNILETNNQLGLVNREKREAMRIIGILNQQVKEKNNTIVRLNIENTNLKKSLAVSNAIRSKFNRQKNALQNENNRLIRIVHDRDTRIERLIRQRDDGNSANERLNAEINTLQDEKKQLSEEISMQNTLLRQFTINLQTSDERINWLNEQLGFAMQTLEIRNTTIEELKALHNTERRKYEEAKAKLQAEENENKDLRKKFQSNGNTLYELETKYNLLLNDIDQKQSELSRLGKEVLSISASGTEIKREHAELLNKFEGLQHVIQSKNDEIQELKHEISSLRTEIQFLRSQIDEKDKFLREKNESISSLWSRLMSTNYELEEKNIQNATLVGDLAKERMDLLEEKKRTLNLTAEIDKRNKLIHSLQLYSGRLSSELIHKNKVINFISEQWRRGFEGNLQVKEELSELRKKYNKLNTEFLKNKHIYESSDLEKIKKISEDEITIERLRSRISSLVAKNKKYVNIINHAREGIYKIIYKRNFNEIKYDDNGNDIIQNLNTINDEIGLLKNKISNMITREEMKRQIEKIRLGNARTIDSMRLIIHSQKKEIEKIRAELKSEEKNKEEIERLNRELSELKIELRGSEEIKEELKRVTGIIRELEFTIELQKLEIDQIRIELESEKKNNSKNKEDLRIANIRIGELTNENSDLKQTIVQQSLANDTLNKKNIELNEQLLASKLAIRFLLLGRRELKEENDKQIAELKEKNDKQNALIDEQNALIGEKKLQLESNQRKLKKLKLQLKKNEKQMKKHKPNNLDLILKKLKKRHDYENIGVPDEKQVGTKELEDLKEEVEGLKLLVEEKELKLNNQEEEAKRYNEGLFETNTHLSEENERIRKENTVMRAKNIKLNDEVRYLQELKDITDRSEEIKILKESNQILRGELEKKDRLIAENAIRLEQAITDGGKLQEAQNSIIRLEREIEIQKQDIETRGNNYQLLYESNTALKKKFEKIDEKEVQLTDDVSFIEKIKELDSKFYLYNIYKYYKKKIIHEEIIRIYDKKYKENKIIYKIREIIDDIKPISIDNDLGKNEDSYYFLYKSFYKQIFSNTSMFDTTINKVINNIKYKLKLNVNAIMDIIDFLDPLSVIYKDDMKSNSEEYVNLNTIIYDLFIQFLDSLLEKSMLENAEKIRLLNDDGDVQKREILSHDKIIEYSNQINLTSGQINNLFDYLGEIRNKSYDSENFDFNKRNDISNTGNSKLSYISQNIICEGKYDENKVVIYDELLEKINKTKQIETPIVVKGGSIVDTLFLMFFNKYVCILVILLLVLLYFYIKCQRQKLNYRKSYRNYLLTINQN